MRFQLLSQEQPRAMHTRRDIVDGEVEDRRDVPGRELLDVAQRVAAQWFKGSHPTPAGIDKLLAGWEQRFQLIEVG